MFTLQSKNYRPLQTKIWFYIATRQITAILSALFTNISLKQSGKPNKLQNLSEESQSLNQLQKFGTGSKPMCSTYPTERMNNGFDYPTYWFQPAEEIVKVMRYSLTRYWQTSVTRQSSVTFHSTATTQHLPTFTQLQKTTGKPFLLIPFTIHSTQSNLTNQNAT